MGIPLRAIAAVIILSSVPVVLSDSSDGDQGHLLITELDPYHEGFTIYNPTVDGVNLKDYRVTDGEGTLTFTHSLTIEPGGHLTIVSAVNEDWFTSRAGAVAYGTSGTSKSGSLVFADTKDELTLLYPSGDVADSVCYGKSDGVSGWSGTPVGISSGRYLLRISADDTDTAADWMSTKPGWTNLAPFKDSYQAEVTPFTFPESGGVPVLNALSSASSSIFISIYLLTSRNVAALLEQKASAGVEVKILLEGKPLGTDIVSGELKYMRAVSDAGGDVRLINYEESGRYVYVHNKYAVIDGHTTVVTSENWTTGNIGGDGNRGWGAVIESTGYASYMTAVFENDFDTSYGDVKALTEVYPLIPATHSYYDEPDAYSTSTYSATVTPVLSPDNSFSSLRTFMGSASTRVYAEQLDLGKSISTASVDGPVAWMAEAADGGCEVRFILDASQSGEEHRQYVEAINYSTTVKAQAVDGGDGFSLIHNKGVIVDDSVWVGSVNWTANSFGNNRECAVVIASRDVTSFFLTYFGKDWGVTIDMVRENGLPFTAACRDTRAGRIVELSADGPVGYSYLFELGDGREVVSDTGHVVFTAPGEPGDYTARVTIVGTDVSATVDYRVEPDGIQVSWVIYAAAACMVVLGAVIAAARGRNNARGGRKNRHGNTRHAPRRR